MDLSPIPREVAFALAYTNELIREARASLKYGGDRERIGAAGELALLRRQKFMLEARLREINRRQAAHETFFAWARHVWFNLTLQFENWIAHG